MAKKTTPAPRRAGTTKAKLEQARRLARKAMRDLGHDPEALATVIAVIRVLANRARSRR